MFEIEKNEFLLQKKVKYKDKNENTITIFADKEGNNFTIKIRPKNSAFTVDNIKFEFPYEMNGVTFKVKQLINKSSEYISANDIPKEIKDILTDSLEIITRWINIQYIIYQISSFPALMKMTKENTFDSGSSFVNILEQGKKYEELNDVMNLYYKTFVEEMR